MSHLAGGDLLLANRYYTFNAKTVNPLSARFAKKDVQYEKFLKCSCHFAKTFNALTFC